MLGREEIQGIIPHRPPFLFLDEIEVLEPGVKAVGYKQVSAEEPHFAGHFPQKPVMPGVLIIEALAQLGAAAMLSLEEYKGKIGYFIGIDKAKFRRMVQPGDRLKLEIEILKRKGTIGVGKGVASVNGQKVAEGELSFIIQ